ncbi:AMP-binding domain containing protein, partial [Asbolus verrucosus]
IFNAAFYCGSTLIFFDHFDPNIFLQTIQNYKVEQLYLVPSLTNFLVNSPLTGLYDLSSKKPKKSWMLKVFFILET